MPTFKAQARPINNREFALFYFQAGKVVPATWLLKPDCIVSQSNTTAADLDLFLESYSIKTVHGPVALKLAID